MNQTSVIITKQTSDEINRFISLRFSNLSRYFLVKRKTQGGESIQSWRPVRKITVFVARLLKVALFKPYSHYIMHYVMH